MRKILVECDTCSEKWVDGESFLGGGWLQKGKLDFCTQACEEEYNEQFCHDPNGTPDSIWSSFHKACTEKSKKEESNNEQDN